MKDYWAELQGEIANCARCDSQLPEACVDCPPGLIYPQGIKPPKPVRVLFVGVAPPKRGSHFYTNPSDNLRRGLFRVLEQLGRPCGDVEGFVARGFFLVHTAKCAIRGTTKPDLQVSEFCSSVHLIKEIECLAPAGLCFLSKKVGFPVYAGLSAHWGFPGLPEFGKLNTLIVNDSSVQVMATAWPGRGHEELTRQHVESLFCHLGLPVWRS